MGKLKKYRFLIVGFVFIFICTFICSILHYHNDGQYHKDCPLCQYSNFLHSIQAECAFTFPNNFDTIIKIYQNDEPISFFTSIQDLVIRPPPMSV